MASSTKRSLDSSSRQSPGIESPAFRMMISPGTTFATGISIGTVSLMTVAVTRIIDNSFKTALEAPRSCQNPSAPLKNTMVRMIPVSTVSPRATEIMDAITRIRIMGFLNCEISRAISFLWPDGRSVFPLS